MKKWFILSLLLLSACSNDPFGDFLSDATSHDEDCGVYPDGTKKSKPGPFGCEPTPGVH